MMADEYVTKPSARENCVFVFQMKKTVASLEETSSVSFNGYGERESSSFFGTLLISLTLRLVRQILELDRCEASLEAPAITIKGV